MVHEGGETSCVFFIAKDQTSHNDVHLNANRNEADKEHVTISVLCVVVF